MAIHHRAGEGFTLNESALRHAQFCRDLAKRTPDQELRLVILRTAWVCEDYGDSEADPSRPPFVGGMKLDFSTRISRVPASMTGEANLRQLLRDLRPRLADRAFTFATVASLEAVPAGTSVVGTFEEDEGLTIIAPFEELNRSNLAHSGAWAKITLAVHSSLSAVGLTASISSALARENISANVVAGYFHDHIFVPWDKREHALRTLATLARSLR